MTFSLWVWRFSIGVMDYSDLLVHDAVSTVNGFRCFEGTKNASWTTWALKMKAPRTFETSCALHPSRCSVVTSQKIGILDRFIVFLSAGSGPGKKKKICGSPTCADRLAVLTLNLKYWLSVAEGLGLGRKGLICTLDNGIEKGKNVCNTVGSRTPSAPPSTGNFYWLTPPPPHRDVETENSGWCFVVLFVSSRLYSGYI